jgi:mono/diheme cytochrome c family protein
MNVMKRRALHRITSGVALGALVAFASAATAAAQDAGQKAFEANKCSNCHSVDKVGIARKIESEKMAGPDMSKVGDKHDAAWIVKFVSRETELDGKQHKSEYKGTKEDLQAIADWLASLKSGA